MKKLALLLIIMCNCLIFSGCLNSVKLNEQAIVQGVSLDLDGGDIVLGLQIFSPTKSDGGNVSPSADNAMIIEARGKTITQALQNATLKQGKKIFLGHNRIVIVSSELAQDGLSDIFKFFSDNTNSRKNVSLAIADGKAIDIIKVKLNQGILPAQMLQNILINTSHTGFAENVLLYDFESTLHNRHESAILPTLKIVEAKKTEEDKPKEEQLQDISSVEINGCGVLIDGKLERIIGKEQTRGVLWLRDKVERTTLVTKTDVFSLCAMDIYKIKTHINTQIIDSKIYIDMKIDSSAAVKELNVTDGKTATPDDIVGIQVAAQKKIESECYSAFNDIVLGMRADICDYGNLVWRENVELWKTIRDDWSDNMGNIVLSVAVKVDIDSVGMEFYTK